MITYRLDLFEDGCIYRTTYHPTLQDARVVGANVSHKNITKVAVNNRYELSALLSRVQTEYRINEAVR